MKNTIKRLTAAILCFCTLTVSSFSMQAYAISDMPATTENVFFSIITDWYERIMSIFTGSTNEKSDVEYTIEKGEIFEAKKYFNSCHASTVVKMQNGNLVSAWFAGTEESDSDVRIWYSVYDGETWREPGQIATADTVAHWNPVLQSDGECTRLYFKVGEKIPYWVTKYVESYDFGETWSEPAELVAGDTSGGRGPVKNKCLVTSKGIIIAPASTEQGSWRAFFDISEDGGKTWTKTDYVVAKNRLGMNVEMIQPTLWEDKEGGIHAMFRTKAGRIYRSDSSDGGYTWSEAYATQLMNNNSGIDCVMTDNGWLWLAYNPIGIDGLRNRLMLSVSKDNGETWQDVVYLEDSPLSLNAEYSYPSIVADGNRIYITYTYTRTRINYAFVEFN